MPKQDQQIYIKRYDNDIVKKEFSDKERKMIDDFNKKIECSRKATDYYTPKDKQ